MESDTLPPAELDPTRQSKKVWAKDQGLRILLALVLEIVFISLVYSLLAFQPQW